MITYFIAAAVFAAAALVRWFLDRSSRADRQYFGGCVELTAVWNRGAAFALPISRAVIRIFSAAALLFAWTQRRRSPVGAGLVLGGGGANLYERLRHGKVYDYVRFPRAAGKGKRYVFDLADFAVFVGAAALLFRRKKG